MGTKIAAGLAGLFMVIALVDVLKYPAGTKAAFDGANGLLRTSVNGALGQSS